MSSNISWAVAACQSGRGAGSSLPSWRFTFVNWVRILIVKYVRRFSLNKKMQIIRVCAFIGLLSFAAAFGPGPAPAPGPSGLCLPDSCT